MHLMQPSARVVLKNPNGRWLSCNEDQYREFSALCRFCADLLRRGWESFNEANSGSSEAERCVRREYNVAPFFQLMFALSLLLRRDSIDSFFQRYFHQSGFLDHAQPRPISQHRSFSDCRQRITRHEPTRVGNFHRGDQSRQIFHDDNGDITNAEIGFSCQSKRVIPAALGYFALLDTSTAKLYCNARP